jgi:hypothetical protein
LIQLKKQHFSTYQHSLINNLYEAHFPLFLHAQNKGYNALFCRRQDSVAQLVEHYTFNVGVLGSSPSGITDL